MPMPLIDFESTRVRDQKRLEQQQARKLMLDRVRKQHESAEQEKVASMQRGEHTWLLPSVQAAIDGQAQDGTLAKKKKKKDKKNKKDKKKKKKKSRKKESSTSSDSSSEEEWVEKCAPAATTDATAVRAGASASAAVTSANAADAPAAAAAASAPPQSQDEASGPKREGWMEMSSLFGTFSRDELRQREGNSRVLAKIKEKNKQPDKPGTSAMELNPYYKDGGSGLPCTQEAAQEAADSAGPQGCSFSLDYLRKALSRAKTQSQEDGIPLEEIAAKRWGSLAKFYAMLKEAEDKQREEPQRPRRVFQRPGDSSDGRKNYYQQPHKSRSPSNCNMMEGRSRTDDRHSRLKDDNIKDKYHDRKSHQDDKYSRHGQSHRKRRSRSSSPSDSSSHTTSSSSSSSRSRSRSRDRKSKSRKTHRRDRSRSRSKELKSRSHSKERSKNRRRSRSKERYRDRSDSSERRSRSPCKVKSNSRRSPSGERSRYQSRYQSPERKTRRLLKPAEDGDQQRPTVEQKPDREEPAVWDKSRVLPSSHAPSRGGWRKRTEQQQVTTDTRSPKTRRSRHSSTSSSDSSDSRSSSDTRHKSKRQPDEKLSRQEDPVVRARASSPAQETKDEKPIKIFTEHELNQLGAKIVKAELMGNQALADKLKKKLDKARKESEDAIKLGLTKDKNADAGKTEEVVLLTTTNARGFTRPVASADPDSSASSGNKKSRKKLKLPTTGVEGQRDKYFPDDHKFNLKQMFEKEKLGGTSDSDAMFVRAAARSSRVTLDDDYTLDDSFVDRSAMREDTAGQDAKERMKAIMDHQRREKVLSSCRHCCDSSAMQKHLIVSLGSKSYLSLPAHQSLVDGHCIIVPREHVATSTLLDEDTWEEMKNYRSSLVRYFASREEDVIFLECCMRVNSHPHTVLHCVPLPTDMGELAPIYYKKAIQESEGEWSQNVKLVDLSGRDVRRAIPKGFPYFAVDFGSMPGYAHVIEDEALFPNYFGQSVVGGMLDIEPQLWRKPRPEKFDEQRRKVLAFAKQYEGFDPTARG